MKTFKETMYFNRSKESNWDIRDKAEELDFANSEDMVWVGMELEMEVEVREDNNHKILKINSVDVSDKNLYV